MIPSPGTNEKIDPGTNYYAGNIVEWVIVLDQGTHTDNRVNNA